MPSTPDDMEEGRDRRAIMAEKGTRQEVVEIEKPRRRRRETET